MSKQTKTTVTRSDEALAPQAFALSTKPLKRKKAMRKTEFVQGDTGKAARNEVTFMSNPRSEGFAAKQMSDDPPWIELLHDLSTMPIMALRAKYAGEANTHRNMLQRVKTFGAVVHSGFRSFPDFLRLVGPKPTKRATLDRIDNHDPEYAPGKVRWADKTTQNRNKGDSLIFNCPNTGRSYTASQLATKQGVSPTAIRKRRRDGWTDWEIIAGERSGLVAKVPVKWASPPPKLPPPPKSHAQRVFEENRRICDSHREEYGTEYFICTPAEFQEISDDVPYVQGEEWLRSCEENFLKNILPRWWKEYGPHIRFHALEPFQQAWVLKIDPSQGKKSELSNAM